MKVPAANSPASTVRPQRATPDVDALASRWVMRKGAGLTAAESDELESWLAADPAHAKAFARLDQMAAVLARARANGSAGAIMAELASRRRWRRSRRRFATAVAVAALALSAGWWGRDHLPAGLSSTRVAVTAPDPIRRLADGSIIELNHGAEIAVRYDAALRQVELLRGEALFRVEKDAARPFVVRVAGIEVRAVGTAFNVRLERSEVEVLVTEGRVGIDDVTSRRSLLPGGRGDEPPLLVAGQQVIVSAPAVARPIPLVRIAEVPAEQIKERLAWRVPRLEFDGVELAEAVRQMNRESRIQILVDDVTLRKLRVSGTFLPDDPQTFARLIAATFGLEAKQRNGSEIVLQRK